MGAVLKSSWSSLASLIKLSRRFCMILLRDGSVARQLVTCHWHVTRHSSSRHSSTRQWLAARHDELTSDETFLTKRAWRADECRAENWKLVMTSWRVMRRFWKNLLTSWRVTSKLFFRLVKRWRADKLKFSKNDEWRVNFFRLANKLFSFFEERINYAS